MKSFFSPSPRISIALASEHFKARMNDERQLTISSHWLIIKFNEFSFSPAHWFDRLNHSFTRPPMCTHIHRFYPPTTASEISKSIFSCYDITIFRLQTLRLDCNAADWLVYARVTQDFVIEKLESVLFIRSFRSTHSLSRTENWMNFQPQTWWLISHRMRRHNKSPFLALA